MVCFQGSVGVQTQYSVHGLSDETGSLDEGYIYDAYGRQTVFAPGTNGTIDWGGDDAVTINGPSLVDNEYMYTGRRFNPELENYYFRNRYYDALRGRFISRYVALQKDPNIYAYQFGRPTFYLDPYGDPNELPPQPPGMEDEYKEFVKWLEENQNLDWMAGLLACHCEVKIVRSVLSGVAGGCGGFLGSTAVKMDCVHPDPDNWTIDLGTMVGFHPGSACCFRSKNADNDAVQQPGQQCCYDKEGKLITGGDGAGTPDKNKPSHGPADVRPWKLAIQLDKAAGGRAFRDAYLSVRPPDQGPKDKPCEKNVVNGE